MRSRESKILQQLSKFGLKEGCSSPFIHFFYLLVTSNGFATFGSLVFVIWIRTYENVRCLLHAKWPFNFSRHTCKEFRWMDGPVIPYLPGLRTGLDEKRPWPKGGLTSRSGGQGQLIEEAFSPLNQNYHHEFSLIRDGETQRSSKII